MKQSMLFTKTRKSGPKDEVAKNAVLLMRAGFIHKEMAGVYSFLPLGLRTLNKIIALIREEMNALGGQEVLLTALQDQTLWQKTNRWADDQNDVWFKSALKNGTAVGLGVTHEEPMTALLAGEVQSYRDLPLLVYQFQTKFRNETRAKSGIMRCREFIMKDLYSFARTAEEHEQMYANVRAAYVRIFERLGIGALTYPTFASGGIFSKYSEEFQTVSAAGEDLIYIDEATGRALNKEVLTDDVLADLGLTRTQLVERKSIEVGNIFTLGTKFSAPLGLVYRDEKGTTQPVYMGCYGIGPGRALGAIVETLSDEQGMVWPESVAPFRAHLLSLGQPEECDRLYAALTRAGVETLYDDRDVSPGEKFADADLIGLPYRIVVGRKSIEAGGAEVKKRTEELGRTIPLTALVDHFTH